MTIMLEEELALGEAICPPCGDVTDDFEGMKCDGCKSLIHTSCGITVELPVSEAGSFYCPDCI